MAKKKKDKFKKEMTLVERKERFRQQVVGEAIILGVMVLYFGLMVSAYGQNYPKAEFLDKVKGVMSVLVGNGEFQGAGPQPLYFLFSYIENGPDFKGIGITLMFVLLAELLVVIYYYFNRSRIHSSLDTLKGSTKWQKTSYMVDKYAEGGSGDRKNKDPFRTEYNNAIVSQNMYVSMNTKKHFKAVNMLILGATGSGKSRYYLKPNILQMNTSYVITDPKGEILNSCGEMLRRNGYNVRVLNITEAGIKKRESDTYNPLATVKGESDIKVVLEAFLKNMDPDGGKNKSDPYWDNATKQFLSACIGLLTTVPKGEYRPYAKIPEISGRIYEACFANLCEMTRMAQEKWREGDPIKLMDGVKMEPDKNAPQKTSKIGAIFENVRAYEAKIQNCTPETIVKPYCLREWENFWGTPEKTATTVMSTTAVHLDPFNIEEVKDLTSSNSIDLGSFGKGRDALFLLIPPANKTYNFIVALLETQLFDLLYKLGDDGCVGSRFMKLQSGELVKFFPKELVDNKEKMDAKFEAIKNSHIERIDGEGIKKGKYKTKNKKGEDIIKTINIDDGWYEIIDADGELVTRRQTLEAANQYISDLKDAYLKVPKIPEIPCHVRFLMDEFPNIGEVPEFKEKLATMRGYEISATVICQSLTQLKGMYPDDYQVIDGNCPFLIYLGGSENDTCEYISKKMGSMTVKGMNNSVDSKKISDSYQLEERAIMKPEEIGRMDYSKQLVIVYGEQPVIDDKFDYPNHRNYKLSRDFAEDCGIDAIKFDRSKFRKKGNTEIIHDGVIASAVPDVQQGSMELFLQIMGVSSPEEAVENVKKAVKRHSFESDSTAEEFD